MISVTNHTVNVKTAKVRPRCNRLHRITTHSCFLYGRIEQLLLWNLLAHGRSKFFFVRMEHVVSSYAILVNVELLFQKKVPINLHSRSSRKSALFCCSYVFNNNQWERAPCSWFDLQPYLIFCYQHHLKKENADKELLVVHAELLKHQKVFTATNFIPLIFRGEGLKHVFISTGWQRIRWFNDYSH